MQIKAKFLRKTHFWSASMLVDFRFENFRSFKKEQTLSMAAFERMREGLESHSVASNRKDIPRLLKVAALYGPNASGKSNVIKALQFMQAKVLNNVPLSNLGYSDPSFRLTEETSEQPTKFEVSLLLDGVCYQYGFSILHDQIIEEYLLAYVKAIPQTWFERTWDSEKKEYNYKYSPSFKGIKNTWEKATRADALYLVAATTLNCEQLKPIYDWFNTKLVVVNELSPLNIGYTAKRVLDSHDSTAVDKILKAADLGISQTYVVPKQAKRTELPFDAIKNNVKVYDDFANAYEVYFAHSTKENTVAFPLVEESMGSQRLYALAGPLLEVIDRDIVLAIDEMDASLHPMILEEIIRLFTHHKGNGKAQLIFTTHCDSLLENSTIPKSKVEPILRRDQIWFTEKNFQLETNLTSLLEFKPRKQESIRDGYRRGRYGALPMISSMA